MTPPKTDAERKAECDRFGVGVLGLIFTPKFHNERTGATTPAYYLTKEYQRILIKDFSPSTNIEQALMVLMEWNKQHNYLMRIDFNIGISGAITVGKHDLTGKTLPDCALKIMETLMEVEGGKECEHPRVQNPPKPKNDHKRA